jgi:hypothetical protein
MKRVSDLECMIESVKVRLDLIDRIPELDYEIALLKLKMNKSEPKG